MAVGPWRTVLEDSLVGPRAPPPSGLQTERGRKASTAAEDNLALSSGAKFWAAGGRGRRMTLALTLLLPPQHHLPNFSHCTGLYTQDETPGCSWVAPEHSKWGHGGKVLFP